MKVLHLISGGDSGGAKTSLFALLSALRHSVYVRVGCLIEGDFYRDLPTLGVDHVLFRQKSRFDLSVVRDIADMINSEGFDILHVHGARANFVASFVRSRVRVPVVTTIHSDYLLDFETPVKKLFFTGLNVYALHRIPYYIAVSHSFCDMMIKRGFMPNSVYTAYNGIDLSAVPKERLPKEDFCRRYGFAYDGGKVYVGIAARLDKVKGVDVFIKAAKEVLKKESSAVFLIAGDGAEKEKLRKLAGDTDRIKFLGHVSDIYSFYGTVDINAVTSRSESFPYSMLEGAALCKPAVASAVGGIPYLLKDGETGYLFPSEDASALAEKLLLLINDKNGRLKMGEALRKRVEAEFSAEAFASRHLEIYERILADHKDKSENGKAYDCIFSGYYGFHNSGDDAVLKVLCDGIRAECRGARIAVLGRHPRRLMREFGVDAFGRARPFETRRGIKSSRVLLFGGGSLLQDKTSKRSLYYYLHVIKLAKRLGLPVMMIANGIGPVRNGRNALRVRDTVNGCVCEITLRDEDSLSRLRGLGVTVPARVTADPALLLGSGTDNGAPSAAGSGKYATLSLRRWSGTSRGFEAAVAGAFRRLSESHGVRAVLLPLQPKKDMKISKRVAALIGDSAAVDEDHLTPEAAVALMRGACLNVSMRLHGLVYSVAAGTPAVALGYDPKVDGFMRHAGLPFVIYAASLDADTLYSTLLSGMRSEVNGERRAELLELSRINAAIAARLIEKEKSRGNAAY